MKNNFYYFLSNSDNEIHRTDEPNINFHIDETQLNFTSIELLGEPDETGACEVLDCVVGYDSLGDIMEVINGGGNDLE